MIEDDVRGLVLGGYCSYEDEEEEKKGGREEKPRNSSTHMNMDRPPEKRRTKAEAPGTPDDKEGRVRCIESQGVRQEPLRLQPRPRPANG